MNPPYLFVDTSAYAGPNPPWYLLAAAPNVVGVIVKATEGTGYNGGGWFANAWPALIAAAPDRYGDTWFRGAYHYLRVKEDGAAQADYYIANVYGAGGFQAGDLLPIVDVELGGANAGATAAQVISSTTAFIARIKELIGRDVIIYGRGAFVTLGITDTFGASWDWDPSWTSEMSIHGIEQFIGRVALWQYSGDGVGAVGLPLSVPGFPSHDMSVFMDSGDIGTSLSTLQSHLLGRPNILLFAALAIGLAVLYRLT